jgi:hypothetical protein
MAVGMQGVPELAIFLFKVIDRFFDRFSKIAEHQFHGIDRDGQQNGIDGHADD